jgi:hypothetical protein
MNSKFPIPSDWRVNASAGICIVCTPCVVTGDVLKVKVMVRSPLLKESESAAIPFTVKSLGWTLLSLTASLKLTSNCVG